MLFVLFEVLVWDWTSDRDFQAAQRNANRMCLMTAEMGIESSISMKSKKSIFLILEPHLGLFAVYFEFVGLFK